MTGDIGAIGELADGIMLARTVEPKAGEVVGRAHRAPGHDAPPNGAHGDALCLNCGTRLIGAHCHRCGQHGHVHRTVGAIGHEIAHGVFHFEGKMWRTLPMLALRPGELTRRYVHGERARFVSPMAIFLFSVFLLFAVMAQLPGWHIGNGQWLGETGLTKARTQVIESRQQVERKIADAQGALAREQARREPDAAEIAENRRELVQLGRERADLIRGEAMLSREGASDDVGVHSKSDWLNAKWRHAKENPQLLLYKIKSSAYKFSWALIPISLPFIWILFPLRRGVGMYDHAVFATYSLSFMSLLAITLAVLGAVGVSAGWLVLAALVLPPLHIYKQLKGAYRLSRVGALFRTWLMTMFAGITSALFVLMLLYLGTAE